MQLTDAVTRATLATVALTCATRVLALALFAGCGQSAVAPARPRAPRMAPPPFTAEQIRAATRPGRTYRFREEEAGRPAHVLVLTFVEVRDADATIETMKLDESGAEIEHLGSSRARWEDLRRHGEFPAAQVRIREGEVSVPAGRFQCSIYEVTEGTAAERTIRRLWFARELPGAPVLFTLEKNGERVSTVTLLEHRPGG